MPRSYKSKINARKSLDQKTNIMKADRDAFNDILKKVNCLKEGTDDLKAELKHSKEEIKLLKLKNGNLNPFNHFFTF